jgi:hypothetical protein
MEPSAWGYNRAKPVPWGYKYRYLTLEVGRVSNLREQNMVMNPAGIGPENDCAGEDQQQL